MAGAQDVFGYGFRLSGLASRGRLRQGVVDLRSESRRSVPHEPSAEAVETLVLGGLFSSVAKQ